MKIGSSYKHSWRARTSSTTFSLLLGMSLLASFAGDAMAAIEFGPADYVVTQQLGDPKPTITASWGSWTGYIAYTDSMSALETHELVFEFESPDYFTSSNSEHWAVAVRADGVTDTDNDGAPNARGRGVVIGNVTGYPSNPPCGPTQNSSAVAMEAFWSSGNCVYGPSTESQGLSNNTRYKIHVISRMENWFTEKIENEYQLWKKVGGSWQLLDVELYEEFSGDNPSPTTLGGFFLSTLNAGKAWTFYIYNLTSYKCGYGQDQCSN
ncbi:MAG: hypothetical protein V2J19_10185 [Wenzhouxiangella sp.]|nr:hypothetical protein [Wenzhouxiangella sp.]